MRSNQELAKALLESPGVDVKQALQQEYIAGELLIKAFSFMASKGVESWLLSYGWNLGVTTHGPVGYTILSAPDLNTALSIWADYSILRSSLASIEFSYTDHQAQIKLKDHTQDELTRRWLSENVVYTTLSLIESITTHPAGDNAQIFFAWPAPSYAKKLEAFFKVKCQFNADFTGLSIPSSWCSINSPLYDQHSFRSNLAKCKELKMQLVGSDNLARSVKLSLQNYFEQRLSGKATANELPSLESLAQQHFMSARTFNRRLHDQVCTYRSILEEVRKEQATNLLSSTHLTASKISYYLAYQEPANFNRAFKRWYATTPAAWRASHTIKLTM